MLVYLGHLSLIILVDEQYVNIPELEACMVSLFWPNSLEFKAQKYFNQKA